MKGTLRLAIGRKGEQPMYLDYDLHVITIDHGLRMYDVETGECADLYDVELGAVARVGGGATPLTALLVSHLIDQKFGGEN